MYSSVNPMLMSDEEFAKWRYEVDPPADAVAKIVLGYVNDQRFIYEVFARIKQNADKVDLKGITITPGTFVNPDNPALLGLTQESLENILKIMLIFNLPMRKKIV